MRSIDAIGGQDQKLPFKPRPSMSGRPFDLRVVAIDVTEMVIAAIARNLAHLFSEEYPVLDVGTDYRKQYFPKFFGPHLQHEVTVRNCVTQTRHRGIQSFRNSSGNFATFAAMRRASSQVSSLAGDRRPGSSSK
ncbi:MAG: hypothetical protein ACLPTZ_00400 [Beijerinckiaceae bacterium]